MFDYLCEWNFTTGNSLLEVVFEINLSCLNTGRSGRVRRADTQEGVQK